MNQAVSGLEYNADSDTLLCSLPPVIAALGSADFPDALMDFIYSAANFDSAVILAYPEERGLLVLHDQLHPGDKAGFSGAYRDGLWLLSPLYLNAKSGRRGFFRLRDIAPSDFQQSEFYHRYYRESGVLDHCGFLAEAGDGTVIVISLERTTELPPYSAVELQTLQMLAGAISALIAQHWQGPLPGNQKGSAALHQQVHAVLNRFGSSLLTPRELQVVQLILRGYPSKLSARELSISSQTERVHRRNIYAKLQLTSHNELFSLFFDALVNDEHGQADPLASLLAKQRSTKTQV